MNELFFLVLASFSIVEKTNSECENCASCFDKDQKFTRSSKAQRKTDRSFSVFSDDLMTLRANHVDDLYENVCKSLFKSIYNSLSIGGGRFFALMVYLFVRSAAALRKLVEMRRTSLFLSFILLSLSWPFSPSDSRQRSSFPLRLVSQLPSVRVQKRLKRKRIQIYSIHPSIDLPTERPTPFR